ncbi:hypothetical protein [Ruegeria atlantica]|uniref:hypothetical protein n=1 Tax=Ruegeria atlantica TaxID=81569 RepID=UPI00147CBD1F|nr:hypothetical protein [Ruegeria atlantica]
MGLTKNQCAMSKRKKEFPGASHYKDRHGVRRWRYRQSGFSAELGSEYGSPDFVRRYENAVSRLKSPSASKRRKALKGTVAALVDSWYESDEFLSLRGSTQKVYKGVVDKFRAEHGTKPVAEMKLRHVKQILAKKANTPSAANNLRKRLIQLMDHAVDLEWRDDNPVRATKTKKLSGDGFHTWSEREIAKFFEFH